MSERGGAKRRPEGFRMRGEEGRVKLWTKSLDKLARNAKIDVVRVLYPFFLTCQRPQDHQTKALHLHLLRKYRQQASRALLLERAYTSGARNLHLL